MYDYKFDWNKSLSVGIAIVDEQHQEFFRIGRKIEQVIMTGGEWLEEKPLLDLLCELREYVTYHFYEEEKYIARLNPQMLPHHHEQHEMFKQWVNEVDCVRLSKEPVAYLKEVKEEMQRWLFHHIMSEDQQALQGAASDEKLE